MRHKVLAGLAIGILLGVGLISVNIQAADTIVTKATFANLNSLQTLPIAINNVKSPTITNPTWLQTILNAEATATGRTYKTISSNNGTVTYDVTTKGAITTDLTEFKKLASQTYGDSRGWSRLGIKFQEVTSAGDFTLVLAAANQVTSFSNSCSSDWSCTVGRYVIINQDRWLFASSAWNAAGGSLQDYRNMVVNHETGHWLGHGHLTGPCNTGQFAPIMQQQSIDLMGCSPNPWPLDGELWSITLGISLS